MVGLLYSLRREHQPEELLEEIYKQRHAFMGITSKTQRVQYANDMRFKYFDYYRQISDVLNKFGYLTSEFYRGIIPAETLKKEKASPESTPFPERLPEHLR